MIPTSLYSVSSYILQDSYGRYMKSPVFKDTMKRAICPEEHKFRYVTAFNSNSFAFN